MVALQEAFDSDHVSFPVNLKAKIPLPDELFKPDFSAELPLALSQLPGDAEDSGRVVLEALALNQALLRRLEGLWKPYIFGMGSNALVVGGAERKPQTGGSRRTDFYAGAMSAAHDNRHDHLVAFRKTFPDAGLPTTASPIWVPGTSSRIGIPVGERRRGQPISVQVADIVLPGGREENVRVDTPAGYIPAIVVRFGFES